jgi:hypothetical protein
MSDSTSFPALSSSSSSPLPIEMRHFRAPNNSMEPTPRKITGDLRPASCGESGLR